MTYAASRFVALGGTFCAALAMGTQALAAGVPAGKLGVKGWGSAKPLAANTGKNGRAQNRRIEILPK